MGAAFASMGGRERKARAIKTKSGARVLRAAALSATVTGKVRKMTRARIISRQAANVRSRVDMIRPTHPTKRDLVIVDARGRTDHCPQTMKSNQQFLLTTVTE
jgi:hypothetical protein